MGAEFELQRISAYSHRCSSGHRRVSTVSALGVDTTGRYVLALWGSILGSVMFVLGLAGAGQGLGAMTEAYGLVPIESHDNALQVRGFSGLGPAMPRAARSRICYC